MRNLIIRYGKDEFKFKRIEMEESVPNHTQHLADINVVCLIIYVQYHIERSTISKLIDTQKGDRLSC